MKLLDKIFGKENLEDEPWLQYYTKQERALKITDKTIYEYLKSCVSEEEYGYTALNYFGRKMDFGLFFNRIDQTSKALLSIGVREGDVVTLLMPNTPEAVISFYAINKIGAIANMVHPLSASGEIKNYLLESKCKYMIMIDIAYEKVKEIIDETLLQKVIIVSAADSMPKLLGLAYKFTRLLKIKRPGFGEENYIAWYDFLLKSISYSRKQEEYEHHMTKDDVAVILHSGGTTGVPKGILISNYNFNAEGQQCVFNVRRVKARDKIVTILPVFHGFGLGVCVHCPLCLKAEVILMPEYDAKRFVNIIKKDKPNVLAGVPTLWEGMMSNNGFDGVDLSSLKYVISGGDYLTESLEEKMNEFLRSHGATISIGKGYGMTESVAATCFTIDGVNKPGSVGVPMMHNKYCICIPNSQEVLPYGSEGEICVSGPSVMMGYLDNEKETNMVLQKHEDGRIWLHTGDCGYITPDGLIFFTQRLKRMIISSGYNVYPAQIEEVIERHPKVLKCSVVGIPHKYKIQVAKAFIVLKENTKPTAKIKKEIKELCEKNLSKHAWPKEYEYRESLPKTLFGKVNYKELEEENKDKK